MAIAGVDDLAYLTIPRLRVFERVRLQDAPQCADALLALVRRVLRQTAMQVLLDLFRAGVDPPLVLSGDALIESGVLETEVQRAGQRFPHLAAEAVWETDLDQTGTLRVAEQSQVPTVRWVLLVSLDALGDEESLLRR